MRAINKSDRKELCNDSDFMHMENSQLAVRWEEVIYWKAKHDKSGGRFPGQVARLSDGRHQEGCFVFSKMNCEIGTMNLCTTPLNQFWPSFKEFEMAHIVLHPHNNPVR